MRALIIVDERHENIQAVVLGCARFGTPKLFNLDQRGAMSRLVPDRYYWLG
jgi:hypothetical protein